MKKMDFGLLNKTFVLFLMTLLLCSCDGLLPKKISDNESDIENEKEIAFQVITGTNGYTSSEYFKGLLLMSDGHYVMFDDEEDYYDFAQTAIMAYLIANNLYDNGCSIEEIEQYLPKVFDLPIENEISDASIKEIFNSVYYNNRDKEIFTTEEKYGYREFPYGQVHEHDSGWLFDIPVGRNSIIIERASISSELKDFNGIEPSAIFIEDGWFY